MTVAAHCAHILRNASNIASGLKYATDNVLVFCISLLAHAVIKIDMC